MAIVQEKQATRTARRRVPWPCPFILAIGFLAACLTSPLAAPQDTEAAQAVSVVFTRTGILARP